jgi:hypothetical protein
MSEVVGAEKGKRTEGSIKDAADFRQALIALVPYGIHMVLTANGTHFTSPGRAGSAARTSSPVWHAETSSVPMPSRLLVPATMSVTA